MTSLSYGAGPYGAGFYGGRDPYWPAILVEIDITTEPTVNIDLDARTWTDITKYVRGGNWTRSGRTAETERTQPGNGSWTLDNRPDPTTGEPFNKDNPLSPFNAAGGLAWSFWIRVSFVCGGLTYRRWTGTKDSLAKDRPGFGKDRTATLTGVTSEKALELFPLAGLNFAIGDSPTRVAAILAAASVAAGAIDSTFQSSIAFPEAIYSASDTTTALAHLQTLEQDERGLVFAQADGGIDFQGRFYRPEKVIEGSMATIGETPGDIRYVDGAPVDNNSYLWNQVAITLPDSSIQSASDATSGDENYERKLSLSSLSDDPAQMLGNAQWYVNRYANPPQRLPQLEILGARDPSTWPKILAAGNSDLFEWQGGDSTMSVFIERVSESFSVAPGTPRIRTFWDTSPSVRDFIWKLGVHGQSELGVTTRLG